MKLSVKTLRYRLCSKDSRIPYRVLGILHVELVGKWRSKFHNTKLPLPTLLCAGYSVKLIYVLYIPIYHLHNHMTHLNYPPVKFSPRFDTTYLLYVIVADMSKVI